MSLRQRQRPRWFDDASIGESWTAYQKATAIGLRLDAALLNIEKLRARYPDGFSSERSINRTTPEQETGK